MGHPSSKQSRSVQIRPIGVRCMAGASKTSVVCTGCAMGAFSVSLAFLNRPLAFNDSDVLRTLQNTLALVLGQSCTDAQCLLRTYLSLTDFVLSIAANHLRTLSVLHVDVSRAYSHAEAQTPVLVRSQVGDRRGIDAGKIGHLVRHRTFRKQEHLTSWEWSNPEERVSSRCRPHCRDETRQ